MGFYFRKSQSLGPIRLNFSKSGVGISTGVTGSRLIFSPKGTYVHLDRHGVYYKKKISFGDKTKSNEVVDRFTEQEAKYNQEGQIETINFDNLTDVDSQDFVNELETKDKKVGLTSAFITVWIFGLIALLVLFFMPQQHLNEKV
ncbi:MAG: DUF4236 domain-containing protein, partial [Bacteroidales bacterium]|nr:DUF4236 domain-containing protein [Bacteroidales bacterium]